MSQELSKGRLIAEWDVSDCMTDDGKSVYIEFFGLKQPKNFIDRIVRWYLRKHSIQPFITQLTTKEIEFK